MHCVKGMFHVKLLDVACVPDLQFYLFSLHTVMPMCSVALDPDGAHRLGNTLYSVHRDTWSFVEATRATNDPIADIGPGQNGAHVYQRPPCFPRSIPC